ncbi:MAG TPA: hypothetical protein VFQ53_39825 [Kofleriaceae bacterium]|nr:hypothetical protein [Kofleriaceae bacterium]
MTRIRSAMLAIALAACSGDNLPAPPGDARLEFEAGTDASIQGDLFGEPCTQPPAPEIGICHDGEGACHDEAAESVCRPFCHVDGVPQCGPRGGVETIDDRGSCVCVPK